MPLLHSFALNRPATIAEACAHLMQPGARVLGGGTDLLVNLRHGIERPPTLVDLSGIAQLGEILDRDDELVIGAGVTLGRLLNELVVLRDFPALAEAAQSVAAPGHRSAATLGGNLCLDTRCVYYNQSETWRRSNGYCLKRDGDICHVAPQGKHCHAAYSGDLAAALIAYESRVEIATPEGVRTQALPELFIEDGAGHLALAQGEFVVNVRLARVQPGTRSAYRKVRARGAIDFPLAGVALALRCEDGRIESLRAAITGTNARPFLLAGTDQLAGQSVNEASLSMLGKLVQKQVSPMRTATTASNYRRQVACVLAQRVLKELAAA